MGERASRQAIVERERAEGNAAFKEGRFGDAVRLYTQALEHGSSCAVIYSNRSAAFASEANYRAALADAERCIVLEPMWAKGFARKAAALHGLQRHAAALQAYDEALQMEPGSKALLLGRDHARVASWDAD